jgi:hypothetical protein
MEAMQPAKKSQTGVCGRLICPNPVTNLIERYCLSNL